MRPGTECSDNIVIPPFPAKHGEIHQSGLGTGEYDGVAFAGNGLPGRNETKIDVFLRSQGIEIVEIADP